MYTLHHLAHWIIYFVHVMMPLVRWIIVRFYHYRKWKGNHKLCFTVHFHNIRVINQSLYYFRLIKSYPNSALISLILIYFWIIIIIIIIVIYGTAAHRDLWSPRSWVFLITYNDAPRSAGLLWTSDKFVAETCTWQHTQQINIHASGWIRTHDRLRLRGHWDRHTSE
jgi:hypothetical protein